MKELVEIIKETVKPNFLNIRTSISVYDRDALCVGAPVGDGLITPFTPQINGLSIFPYGFLMLISL